MSQGTDDMNKLNNGRQQLTQNLPDMVDCPRIEWVHPATCAWQASQWQRWRNRASGTEKAVVEEMGCTWDGGEHGEYTVPTN